MSGTPRVVTGISPSWGDLTGEAHVRSRPFGGVCLRSGLSPVLFFLAPPEMREVLGVGVSRSRGERSDPVCVCKAGETGGNKGIQDRFQSINVWNMDDHGSNETTRRRFDIPNMII